MGKDKSKKKDKRARKDADRGLAGDAGLPAPDSGLGALYDGAPVALAFIDRDLRVRRANARMARIVGLPASDLPGRTLREALPHLPPETEAICRMALATGEPARGLATGSAPHGLLDIEPVVGPDGGIAGLNAAVLDVPAPAEPRPRGEEEPLRHAFEAMDGLVYDWDFSTGRVERGGGLGMRLGYAPDEIPPRADWWRALAHPDDLGPLAAGIDTALSARQERLVAGYRIRHGDGRWIDVLERITVTYGSDGPLRALGSVTDVTDRKAAETARAERESGLRAAIEAAGLGFWDFDLLTGAAIRSPRHDLLFGYEEPQPDWGPAAAERHLLEEDRPVFREGFARALETGSLGLEVRVRWPDGSVRRIALSGRTRFDAAGQPVRLAGIAEDVSGLRAAEEALAEAEARFRQRLAAVPQMLWSARPDGAADFYSARWYEFTGVAPGATDGDGWALVCHPEDRPRVWERWRRSLASGEPYEIEYRLRHRSGDYRWVQARARPIRDGSGAIAAWMGAVADIHDLAGAREALEEGRAEIGRLRSEIDDAQAGIARVEAAAERAQASYEEQLAERAADLDRAGAQLAEEARQRGVALARIARLDLLRQLASEVAQEAGRAVAVMAEGFAAIDRRSEDGWLTEIARRGTAAATRAARLLHQIQALGPRPEAEPRTVDLRALLREAEPLLSRLAGGTIALRVDCPDGLPALHADPILLESALVGLVADACDAMSEGGTLAIAAHPAPPAESDDLPGPESPGAVALSVTYAGPPSATDGPCHGTGLALAEEVARRPGGTLRVESLEGAGTTVTLVLPRAAPPAEAEPPPGAGSPQAAVPGLGDADPGGSLALDRLEARLRSDRLRAMLAQWRAARGRAALPRFDDFDPSAGGPPQEVVLAEVDASLAPPGLRFAAAGDGRAAIPFPAGLEAGWRRCAETAEPVHEYARIALGSGGPATFERLLLPWSTDGRGADRLVGLVVIGGPAPQGGRTESTAA